MNNRYMGTSGRIHTLTPNIFGDIISNSHLLPSKDNPPEMSSCVPTIDVNFEKFLMSMEEVDAKKGCTMFQPNLVEVFFQIPSPVWHD